MRAALALEEAGKLPEAARVFEFAGEHAEAAALRLEHANTLRDRQLRLDVLREGCARNHGETAQGKALHLAFGEALLEQVAVTSDDAMRRSLRIEAAHALDRADASERAGDLFESLGLLSRAAEAYQRAGSIQRFESVLAILDHRERVDAAAHAFEAAVERCVHEGRRREARLALRDYQRGQEREEHPARPSLARIAARLDACRTRPGRVDLCDELGNIVRVRASDELLIGRAPEADVSLPVAALSRRHVALSVAPDDTGTLRLRAVDQGSRAGTFWDDEPLAPGEPHVLDGAGSLGLGFATSLDVRPVTSANGDVAGALLRAPEGGPGWTLFLPHGGPLWLTPERLAPARMEFVDHDSRMVVAFDTSMWLVEEPLGPGVQIELLVGDRMRLTRPGAAPWTLEVIA